MSRLSELIAELCPDGVEYKELGELLDYEQPSKYIVKSTDYCDNFNVPVLTAGKGLLLGFTNETDGIYNASEDNPVIIFDDFTTSFHWISYAFKVKSSAMKMLRPKQGTENSFRYLYYAMKRVEYVPESHTRQWINKCSKFRIPVPPIEVQREVVRILDEYTAAHDELIRCLHEEMRLCEQQLATARNELLKFNGKVKWISLGEIAQVSSGATPPRKNGSLYSGSIPWVKTGEVARGDIAETEEHISEEALVTTSCRLYPAGTVLIAMYGQGDTRGKSAMLMTSAATNQACAALEFRDGINPLFVLKQLQARYKELRVTFKGKRSFS